MALQKPSALSSTIYKIEQKKTQEPFHGLDMIHSFNGLSHMMCNGDFVRRKAAQSARRSVRTLEELFAATFKGPCLKAQIATFAQKAQTK